MITLELPGAFLLVAFIFLLIGYAMGRNSAGLPLNSVEKEKTFNPGPVIEEEDQFNEAMYGEETEDEKRKARIETV